MMQQHFQHYKIIRIFQYINGQSVLGNFDDLDLI